MSSDLEMGRGGSGEKADGTAPPRKTGSNELYSNSIDEVHQGTGVLAALRRFEARMDAKLGVESEDITRKMPEDKHPVPWHQELSMALLWASGTVIGHSLGL